MIQTHVREGRGFTTDSTVIFPLGMCSLQVLDLRLTYIWPCAKQVASSSISSYIPMGWKFLEERDSSVLPPWVRGGVCGVQKRRWWGGRGGLRAAELRVGWVFSSYLVKRKISMDTVLSFLPLLFRQQHKEGSMGIPFLF